MKWYLRSCPVCHGDLHDDLEDQGWITCFMCGRSFEMRDVLGPRAVEELQPLAFPERPPVEAPRAA